MTRNSDGTFQIDSPVTRDRATVARQPAQTPLIDGTRRHWRTVGAELGGQLRTRAGRVDGEGNWVFHACQFGIENSERQGASDAESSGPSRHAGSMNTKLEFSRRLALALDRAGVDTRQPIRKKWIHEKFNVTERQAGNYLKGEQLPTSEGMMKIALVTGVSWEWLVTGRGPMLPLRLTDDQSDMLSRMSRDELDRLFGIARLLPVQAA